MTAGCAGGRSEEETYCNYLVIKTVYLFNITNFSAFTVDTVWLWWTRVLCWRNGHWRPCGWRLRGSCRWLWSWRTHLWGWQWSFGFWFIESLLAARCVRCVRAVGICRAGLWWGAVTFARSAGAINVAAPIASAHRRIV